MAAEKLRLEILIPVFSLSPDVVRRLLLLSGIKAGSA